MKIDALHAAAGISLAKEQDEALSPVLLETALGFLRAGGRLSLQDWAALDENSRAAFIAAGDMFHAQLAGKIGQAASGPEGLARVIGEIDGGRASAQLAVDRVAEKAAQRRSGKGGA